MKQSQNWQAFIDNCNSFNDSKELKKFLELVLTRSEVEKIAARYQILIELSSEELTQREIAQKVGVSIFNITRGANQLKLADKATKKLINGKK
ncbi:MAG: trp operon repressor [Burkholderiales bacterium]|nr:trp operon repressor [Burkholderiales bacterium]